jgi:general L-amino acid transport system substrate-binding protein
MVSVIEAVGNYGEIYDRHFGTKSPVDMPRGQNNLASKGGLLYSPPFR